MAGRSEDVAVPWVGNSSRLKFPDDLPAQDGRQSVEWRGVSAEHVTIQGPKEYEFQWTGSSNYVALHDLRLTDGELLVDGAVTPRMLDLRQRLTFIPRGRTVSGWCSVESGYNSFTAIYYDPAIVPEELESHSHGVDEKPLVHFIEPGLRSTVGKIQSILKTPTYGDALYGETLGVVAALEIDRLRRAGPPRYVPESGRLSVGQERLVRNYIEENLHTSIALADLAALVRLSRFHFTRSFKKTVGLPPHQFVLHRRVEQAKDLLQKGEHSIRDISQLLGFGSQSQFSTAFQKIAGCSPSQFRRLNR